MEHLTQSHTPRITPNDISSLPKAKVEFTECAKRIKQLLLPFSQMNEVIADIADIHQLGKDDTSTRAKGSQGLCIIGEPRSGKSELIDIYAKDIAPNPERVLVIGFPSTSTHRQFTVKLLAGLGDPYPSEGKPEERMNRCLRLMKEQNIELIILDEAQHLLNSSANPEGQQRGADWLKEFLDAASVPFVVSGPPRAKEIFRYQPELSGRIAEFIEYQPLSWDDKKKRDEFFSVLDFCEDILPFSHTSNLSDDQIASTIYDATNGKIGLIKRLILRAAQLAIRNERPAISQTDIDQAILSTQIDGKG